MRLCHGRPVSARCSPTRPEPRGSARTQHRTSTMQPNPCDVVHERSLRAALGCFGAATPFTWTAASLAHWHSAATCVARQLCGQMAAAWGPHGHQPPRCCSSNTHTQPVTRQARNQSRCDALQAASPLSPQHTLSQWCVWGCRLLPSTGGNQACQGTTTLHTLPAVWYSSTFNGTRCIHGYSPLSFTFPARSVVYGEWQSPPLVAHAGAEDGTGVTS